MDVLEVVATPTSSSFATYLAVYLSMRTTAAPSLENSSHSTSRLMIVKAVSNGDTSLIRQFHAEGRCNLCRWYVTSFATNSATRRLFSIEVLCVVTTPASRNVVTYLVVNLSMRQPLCHPSKTGHASPRFDDCKSSVKR
eukprot:scpid66387/ scgid29404/ 